MKDRHIQGLGDQTQGAEESIPRHSPEGVDLTLIRWMLTLQENVRSILRLRHERSTKN